MLVGCPTEARQEKTERAQVQNNRVALLVIAVESQAKYNRSKAVQKVDICWCH